MMRFWILRSPNGYACVEDEESPSADDVRWVTKGVSEDWIHEHNPDLSMRVGDIREVASLRITLKEPA